MMELMAGILPGIAAMDNIHPMVVHYPIALLSAFFLMELLGSLLGIERFRTAATWMLYLGALGAATAVATGLYAEATVEHADQVHAVMERHGAFGISVLVSAVILSLWRIRVLARFSFKARVVYLIAAFVMLVLMSLGADLGGLMVYKHGVSVSAARQEGAHNHNDAGSENAEEAAEHQDKGRHSEDGHDQASEASEPHGKPGHAH